LKAYYGYMGPLKGKPLKKSKKVFDTSKVTDHHAIIPTGVPVANLSDMESHVYDLIARRFIGVFYPDCRFSTTTVLGEANEIPFKVTGKQILDPGWRTVVYGNEKKETEADTEDKNTDEERTLPAFVKGESGPHEPTLTEKWTLPPKPYTEATLLRAMETAGKLTDNEALRDALKENGIGRPSTRAAIIETLFKRHYIRKERKNLIATPTGVELIGLIREELLKSVELTGMWEKKLREIEHRTYDAHTFIEELKAMVCEIVRTVREDNSDRFISLEPEPEGKKPSAKSKTRAPKPVKKEPQPQAVSNPAKQPEVKHDVRPDDTLVGTPCPLCGVGTIIKGRTAYGCSRWKEGCNYRLPFDTSESQS
jgi:DNA topoisomerase III